MKKLQRRPGFTLIEVIVSSAVLVLFAMGIYGAFQMVMKAVYKSRINIIETALLDEYVEIARNLPFSSIGIINGLPPGVLPHTTTTIRNGIPFLVTTAVRNIDDPFDGTLGGTPNDLAPADYKLVEITVDCITCQYPTKSTVSSVIPPKDLEGSTNNGAIFIHVTDSHNNPVIGANVHVVNAKVFPNIIIDDVTDKDGYLRIIDTPTGTFAYDIAVSQTGYSMDSTTASTTLNPAPTKLPVTVTAQTITDIYFAIDQLSSLTVHTVNEACDAIGNTNFTMVGNKLIGTPDVYKYSQDLQTGADGNLDINNLEYDTYSFVMNGSHDIAGSIPITPLEVTAGGHKDLTLVLMPHLTNSLLVKVVDNANGLPVSDATVKLTKTGYAATQKTNFGYLSQTDWSGGNNSEYFGSETASSTMFYSNSGLDVYSAPGNVTLQQFVGLYVGSGWLESSIFDIGKRVDLKNIIFSSELLPPETGERSILLQLATSNSSTLSSLTDFVGPDGTSATYYSSTSTIIFTGGQQYRYFRYKLYLSTQDQNFTPAFSDFAVTFTNGCTPPGQVFFRGMTAGAYDLEVSAAGYNTTTIPIDIGGRSTSTVNLFQSI